MTNRVWSKFQVTKSDGTSLKLRIQDLPQNKQGDAIELIMTYFATEEKFHKATGVAKNPKAMAETRAIISGSMKDPAFHGVICCEDNDGEVGQIVGCSLIELVLPGSKQFGDLKLETEEVREVFKLIDVVSILYDPIEKLTLSSYYDGRGLVVHPKYRHLGIATEFFKARGLACVAHNVPATGAFMTSIGSQKAAERANWETLLEVHLDKLQRHGVTFEHAGVRKFMIWRQPQCIDENGPH